MVRQKQRAQLNEWPIWVYFLITVIAFGVLTAINGGL